MAADHARAPRSWCARTELAISGRLLAWVLVGGFLGAHLVDRLVYFPADTLADPWSLLRIWEGLSSFGGFLGARRGARCGRPGDSYGHRAVTTPVTTQER